MSVIVLGGSCPSNRGDCPRGSCHTGVMSILKKSDNAHCDNTDQNMA